MKSEKPVAEPKNSLDVPRPPAPNDDELKKLTLGIFGYDHVSIEYLPKSKQLVMKSRQTGDILHKLPLPLANVLGLQGFSREVADLANEVRDLIRILAMALVPPQEGAEEDAEA